MRIGFYNPYFDSMSGGERYTLMLASHWSEKHDVHIFWDDPTITQESSKRLNIDLSRVKVVPNVFGGNNIVKKMLVSRQYDLIFFLSDGSVPMTLANRNILHFQVPFTRVSAASWKLKRYQDVVVNSQFTKDHLDPRIATRAQVIYPAVEGVVGKDSKQKIILSVGRFTSFGHGKKQDVLIDAFRRGYEKGYFTGWKLVLAGGLLPSDEEYFHGLADKARRLPVELKPNIAHEELAVLYSRASFYWHAAGFGETDPARMEHFGITTVEAMSAGCVPVVYAAGGQKEIIANAVNGFFWNDIDDLISLTRQCIEKPDTLVVIGKEAQKRAAEFAPVRFYAAYDRLLEGRHL